MNGTRIIRSIETNLKACRHASGVNYLWKQQSGSTGACVRIRSTVLTQPGTPVSFRGMFIRSLFNFRKTPELRRFRFPETPDSDVFRYFRIM